MRLAKIRASNPHCSKNSFVVVDNSSKPTLQLRGKGACADLLAKKWYVVTNIAVIGL